MSMEFGDGMVIERVGIEYQVRKNKEPKVVFDEYEGPTYEVLFANQKLTECVAFIQLYRQGIIKVAMV